MARADVRGRRRNLSAEAGRRGDEQSGFRVRRSAKTNRIRDDVEGKGDIDQRGKSGGSPDDRPGGRARFSCRRAERSSGASARGAFARFGGIRSPALSVAECRRNRRRLRFDERSRIESDGNYEISLALAPVAVLPEFQRQGIGSALIREAHPAALRILDTGPPSYWGIRIIIRGSDIGRRPISASRFLSGFRRSAVWRSSCCRADWKA